MEVENNWRLYTEEVANVEFERYVRECNVYETLGPAMALLFQLPVKPPNLPEFFAEFIENGAQRMTRIAMHKAELCYLTSQNGDLARQIEMLKNDSDNLEEALSMCHPLNESITNGDKLSFLKCLDNPPFPPPLFSPCGERNVTRLTKIDEQLSPTSTANSSHGTKNNDRDPMRQTTLKKAETLIDFIQDLKDLDPEGIIYSYEKAEMMRLKELKGDELLFKKERLLDQLDEAGTEIDLNQREIVNFKLSQSINSVKSTEFNQRKKEPIDFRGRMSWSKGLSVPSKEDKEKFECSKRISCKAINHPDVNSFEDSTLAELAAEGEILNKDFFDNHFFNFYSPELDELRNFCSKVKPPRIDCNNREEVEIKGVEEKDQEVKEDDDGAKAKVAVAAEKRILSEEDAFDIQGLEERLKLICPPEDEYDQYICEDEEYDQENEYRNICELICEDGPCPLVATKELYKSREEFKGESEIDYNINNYSHVALSECQGEDHRGSVHLFCGSSGAFVPGTSSMISKNGLPKLASYKTKISGTKKPLEMTMGPFETIKKPLKNTKPLETKKTSQPTKKTPVTKKAPEVRKNSETMKLPETKKSPGTKNASGMMDKDFELKGTKGDCKELHGEELGEDGWFYGEGPWKFPKLPKVPVKCDSLDDFNDDADDYFLDCYASLNRDSKN